jgi:hypothetical protein
MRSFLDTSDRIISRCFPKNSSYLSPLFPHLSGILRFDKKWSAKQKRTCALAAAGYMLPFLSHGWLQVIPVVLSWKYLRLDTLLSPCVEAEILSGICFPLCLPAREKKLWRWTDMLRKRTGEKGMSYADGGAPGQEIQNLERATCSAETVACAAQQCATVGF